MTEELRLSGLLRTRLDRVSAMLFGLGAVGLQEASLPGEAPAPRQPWDTGPPPPESERLVLSAWFEDVDHALVEGRIRAAVSPVRPEWHPVVEVDWEAVYRASFSPIVVSPRLVVAPPWDAPPGALVIEPGQGFGTGHHPTTLQALRALDGLADGLRTALDVGCGSGILALAAARLGLSVRGIDVEEAAIRDAHRNAAANGLAGEFSTQPIAEVEEPADLVLANLHAELVTALAPHLVRLTGTWLVVAGILADRETMVRIDLPLVSRVSDGEWVCLTFRRAQ